MYAQPTGGLRAERSQAQQWREFLSRFAFSLVGGAFLIVPMWIMVKLKDMHPDLPLIVTTLSVFICGIAAARMLDEPEAVLSITAAYAGGAGRVRRHQRRYVGRQLRWSGQKLVSRTGTWTWLSRIEASNGKYITLPTGCPGHLQARAGRRTGRGRGGVTGRLNMHTAEVGLFYIPWETTRKEGFIPNNCAVSGVNQEE